MSGSIGTISLITKTGEYERRYFINNPDITFFKSVYRKHTNFCKYFKKNLLSERSNDSLNLSYDIQSGSDDLLSKIYLENKIFIKKGESVQQEEDLVICSNLGSNFIKEDDESLSITIGSNRAIFKSYGLFQEVKGELLNQMSLTSDNTGTHAPQLQLGDDIISCKNGSHYNYTTLSGGVRGITIDYDSFSGDNTIQTEYFYTIPEFSFMKDYGLALPLLCMRNENINLNVKLKPKDKLIHAVDGYELTFECNLIQELIQLDNDEKSRFLTSQLNYLTESIVPIDISSKNQDIKSAFKLCKYLLLVGKPGENSQPSEKSSLTTPTSLNFTQLNINVGGNTLFPGVNKLPKEIFSKININKYFIGCGRDLEQGSEQVQENHGQLDSIAMIPLSIEPLNYTQPSGCISNEALNGSIKLELESTEDNPEIKLYGIIYNILQISNGRAQLYNS